MRIAIVSDAWRPQINGVVRTIETVVKLLQAEGHEVEVFGPDRFRTLPCPTYPEIRLSLFPSARLAHMLALFAPDAIHLVTEGPLGWAARNFCLARDIPFTSAYHTRFPEYVHARIRAPLSWSYALVRRFHARSAAVLVVAQSIRDELAARGFKNLVPWSRGVDIAAFKPQPRQELKDGRPIWLYAGRIAIEKAGPKAKGSVLASDAFFPFRDNVDQAAAAGVAAIVQPGGSKRDAETIAACDEHGVAMSFTGVRHFRH